MGFLIENLSFAYRSGAPAVDRFSLAIDAGRFYGLVGPNGCGKSTLLDLISGQRTPALGHIHYGGRTLAQWTRQQLAREIALVPQNFYINFPFSAREVVMMGRYPHIPRFAAPSQEDEHLVDRIMALTDTDRFAQRAVSELSGGERQRVVIARALAQDTPVLLLDEATSNLDIRHTLSLLSLAASGWQERTQRQPRERTLIAVMQDLNLAAMYCDDIIFMRNGRPVACGAVEEVFTAENIASVFGVRARIFHDEANDCLQAAYRKNAVVGENS